MLLCCQDLQSDQPFAPETHFEGAASAYFHPVAKPENQLFEVCWVPPRTSTSLYAGTPTRISMALDSDERACIAHIEADASPPAQGVFDHHPYALI